MKVLLIFVFIVIGSGLTGQNSKEKWHHQESYSFSYRQRYTIHCIPNQLSRDYYFRIWPAICNFLNEDEGILLSSINKFEVSIHLKIGELGEKSALVVEKVSIVTDESNGSKLEEKIIEFLKTKFYEFKYYLIYPTDRLTERNFVVQFLLEKY